MQRATPRHKVIAQVPSHSWDRDPISGLYSLIAKGRRKQLVFERHFRVCKSPSAFIIAFLMESQAIL